MWYKKPLTSSISVKIKFNMIHVKAEDKKTSLHIEQKFVPLPIQTYGDAACSTVL